jgi:hypothetical protein
VACRCPRASAKWSGRRARSRRGAPCRSSSTKDDHFEFDQPENNFVAAVRAGASWGFFDYRMKDEGPADGYQSVPVNWGISSPRKRAFFEKLREITGRL